MLILVQQIFVNNFAQNIKTYKKVTLCSSKVNV